MSLKKSTLDVIPKSPFRAHGQIDYRVEGRILHAIAIGPFDTELIAAIPATIGELVANLAQQGKWGQIVVFKKSAAVYPMALEEFGAYLKRRYNNPDSNPTTALVFETSLDSGLLTAPKFLKCYQDAGVESRVFEDYNTALDWVQSRIRQISVRIEWDDSYKIGDAAIDEQHQELFKRAAYVIAATSHRGQVICITRLFQYMLTHLSHEEDLMRQLQYPDIESHISSHQEMISSLNAISGKIAKENLVKADLEDFIARWLVTHIASEDGKLAQYIKSK